MGGFTDSGHAATVTFPKREILFFHHLFEKAQTVPITLPSIHLVRTLLHYLCFTYLPCSLKYRGLTLFKAMQRQVEQNGRHEQKNDNGPPDPCGWGLEGSAEDILEDDEKKADIEKNADQRKGEQKCYLPNRRVTKQDQAE